MTPLERVLSRLQGVKQEANGSFTALCPVHESPPEGHRPSLNVREAPDGKALLTCRSKGCTAQQIVTTVGLSMADLFPEKRPPARTPAGVAGEPLRETGRWQIRALDGHVVAVHVRVEPGKNGRDKDCLWYRADGTTPGLDGTKLADLPLYGSEHLATFKRVEPVFLVEGEKCADALLWLGFQAVGTVTGARSFPSSKVLETLHGLRVTPWPDADEPGRQHMARIAEQLQGIAAEVRLIVPPAGVKAGWDVADLVAEHPGAVDEAREAVLKLLAAAKGPHRPYVLASTIKPRRMIWLRWLPRGTLSILAGNGGLGKSCLLIDLAAELSRSGIPSLLVTGEDNAETIVVPRLLAAGANLHLVALWRDPLVLPDDLAALAKAITDLKAGFVAIDPMSAFLASGIDSHKAASLRQVLSPLTRLAEDLDCTMAVLGHLNKGGGYEAAQRVAGSEALVNAARHALLVAPDPEDPTRNILSVFKSNVTVADRIVPLAYRIEESRVEADGESDPLRVPRIVWLGEAPEVDRKTLLKASDPEEESVGAKRRRAAVEALQKAPGRELDRPSLREAVCKVVADTSEDTCQKLLAALRREGVIEGDGRSGPIRLKPSETAGSEPEPGNRASPGGESDTRNRNSPYRENSDSESVPAPAVGPHEAVPEGPEKTVAEPAADEPDYGDLPIQEPTR